MRMQLQLDEGLVRPQLSVELHEVLLLLLHFPCKLSMFQLDGVESWKSLQAGKAAISTLTFRDTSQSKPMNETC